MAPLHSVCFITALAFLSVVSAIPQAQVRPPSLVGCFSSSEPLVNQGYYKYQSSGHCIDVCTDQGAGYGVTGLSNGSLCWCGSFVPAANTRVPNSRCDSPCQGYDLEDCGGGTDYFTIWLTGLRASVPYFPSNGNTGSPSAGSTRTSTGSTASTRTSAATGTNSGKTSTSRASTGSTATGTAAGASNTDGNQSTKSDSGNSQDRLLGIILGVVLGVTAILVLVIVLLLMQRRRSETGDYFRARTPSPGSSDVERRGLKGAAATPAAASEKSGISGSRDATSTPADYEIRDAVAVPVIPQKYETREASPVPVAPRQYEIRNPTAATPSPQNSNFNEPVIIPPTPVKRDVEPAAPERYEYQVTRSQQPLEPPAPVFLAPSLRQGSFTEDIDQPSTPLEPPAPTFLAPSLRQGSYTTTSDQPFYTPAEGRSFSFSSSMYQNADGPPPIPAEHQQSGGGLYRDYETTGGPNTASENDGHRLPTQTSFLELDPQYEENQRNSVRSEDESLADWGLGFASTKGEEPTTPPDARYPSGDSALDRFDFTESGDRWRSLHTSAEQQWMGSSRQT